MNDHSESKKLIHTEQGRKWLEQFDDLDKDAAIAVANNLVLISHNEFERNLIKKIEEVAARIQGAIGLFAVREVAHDEKATDYRKFVVPFYSQVTSSDGKSVNALAPSADQGSEARIANMIRQLCRLRPKKFLSHPTLELLRVTSCDAIFFLDDLVGSGGRVNDFLTSFWREPSIVSWLSGKQIYFHVISYSATENGLALLAKHKSKPAIHIYRDAPTFENIFWSAEKKKLVKGICEKYGRIANKKRKNMWWGYKEGMAAIVFEHGCPNNTPAILWEPDYDGSGWIGLFPSRAMSSEVASVFPAEIVRNDPIQILVNEGQLKVANHGALLRRGTMGQIILTALALIAKGQRKRSTLAYATGLNVQDCEKLIAKCIKWNFVNPQRRITPKGLAELKVARKAKLVKATSVDIGSEYYYPRQLREATYD